MTIRTTIGYATTQDIFVRGQNLSTEIIPNADFVDMACLCILGRYPEPRFKRMMNVILVTSCDHGFTPISMAGRLTFLGAPESLQGAVAAGLLGAGDRYLGVTQNVAQMLSDETHGLADDSPPDQFEARARDLLTRYAAQKKRIAGVGHPIHVDGDPRVQALRTVSRDNGYYGRHWKLLDAIAGVNQAAFGKLLPINGAGAMGAIAAEMGLDPKAARGLALVGRTAGLIAHIIEEANTPVAPNMWKLVLDAEQTGK
ncbi:citryl-CoA lyase [Bordetella sp. BOR01]|uniref:citryl-CoA lyase n=1 Tax=Bordetella sp. BOR01 TaxID=2854779 RepID=UPI001C44F80C|nr:citryl-CoA lyase [Bordetella sp. BOR01]MBV7483571.1 citryl-CoA lyase [Bordetella sp. BOR01]